MWRFAVDRTPCARCAVSGRTEWGSVPDHAPSVLEKRTEKRNVVSIFDHVISQDQRYREGCTGVLHQGLCEVCATLSSKWLRAELIWGMMGLFGSKERCTCGRFGGVDKTDGACEGDASNVQPGGTRPQFPVTGVGKPHPGRYSSNRKMVLWFRFMQGVCNVAPPRISVALDSAYRNGLRARGLRSWVGGSGVGMGCWRVGSPRHQDLKEGVLTLEPAAIIHSTAGNRAAQLV